MARQIPERDISPILASVQVWKNQCLLSDGSIFSKEPVWTKESLALFNHNVVQAPDEGEGSFQTKFRDQTTGGGPPLCKLAAEFLWLHFAFPSTLKRETKVSQIREVYGWSGEELNPDHPMLESLADGIGGTGSVYSIRRWEELVYLYQISSAVRDLAQGAKKKLLAEPWSFANWADETADVNRLSRHILPFLLFPESFERIASKHHKKAIAECWSGLADEADTETTDSPHVTLDKKLLAVRRGLEKQHPGKTVDFYVEPWRSSWDAPAPTKPSDADLTVNEDSSVPNTAMAGLMDRFKRIMPDFKDFEHPGKKLPKYELDYKRKLLADFQAGREELEAAIDEGRTLDAIEQLKKLIQPTNLVNWRGWELAFGKPVNEEASLAILRAIREVSEGPYSAEKLDPLFRIFRRYDQKPGWTLLTVLLWLWNPREYYPIKSSCVRKFASMLGRKIKMTSPAPEAMEEFMQLGQDTRAMLEPWKPQNWVDVQSFIWVVTQWEAPEEKLAEPFNQCFDSLEEADFLLDWMETALQTLGLESNLETDPRVAITLPGYGGKTGTIRMNFGSWPAVSIIRETGGDRFLQFICDGALVPRGAIVEAGDSSSAAPSGEGQTLILVPVELLDETSIAEALLPSMKHLKLHFEGWKGTPYRKYHHKELCGLFFNKERRRELLLNGLKTWPPVDVATTSYSKAQALKELFIDEADYNRMTQLLRRKKNLILKGPPGVGKSFMAKRLAYSHMGEKDESRVTMIQFHQSYAYEDFIQGYRPSGGDGASFEKRDGVFYTFCETARFDPDRDYYFIIDEINRGNLSRIFGELMLLVEPDKRGPDFALPLTYSPDRTFYVPANVHLIGMMNTADRSLAMVDYALRRRFAFIDLKPAFESDKFIAHLKLQKVPNNKAKQIQVAMGALNKQIAESTRDLGEGYCIGHSFFCPTQPVDDVESWYREIIETEIQPLLEEYWADSDGGKVAAEIEKLLNGE